jgi:hypothetical protein
MGRADQSTLGRERLGGRSRVGRSSRDGVSQSGETEIEQFHFAFHHKDVSRLQVTVDYAGTVGSVQSIGNLDGMLQRELQRKRSLDRLSIEVFHDEKGCARMFADIVQNTDVPVIQVRQGARFLCNALLAVFIDDCVARQGLDGDGATESGVYYGLVHLTHSPGGDVRSDVVRAKACAGAISMVAWAFYVESDSHASSARLEYCQQPVGVRTRGRSICAARRRNRSSLHTGERSNGSVRPEALQAAGITIRR